MKYVWTMTYSTGIEALVQIPFSTILYRYRLGRSIRVGTKYNSRLGLDLSLSVTTVSPCSSICFYTVM